MQLSLRNSDDMGISKLNFDVDAILFRSSFIPNGIRLQNTAKQLTVYRTQDVPVDESFRTENGNQITRINKKELALVSSTTGDMIIIPVTSLSTETTMPKLRVDYSALNTGSESSAEAVIEVLNGKNLITGIQLRKKNELEAGKIIFSLEDLPTGITFIDDYGNSIYRTAYNSFTINDKNYLPSSTNLMMSPRSKAQEEENAQTQKQMQEQQASRQSPSPSPRTQSPNQTQDSTNSFANEYDEDDVLSMELYDERLLQAKQRRKSESKKKLNSIMQLYKQHYERNFTEPLGEKIEQLTTRAKRPDNATPNGK